MAYSDKMVFLSASLLAASCIAGELSQVLGFSQDGSRESLTPIGSGSDFSGST